MAASVYREVAPDPRLGKVVVCYWYIVEPDGPALNRVLPDGCFDLLFVVDGTVRPGEEGHLRNGNVIGPMSRPLVVEFGTGTLIVGVRLKPGYLSRFLRIDLDRLLDGSVPGEALLGSSFRDLERRVGAAGSPEAAIALLEAYLLNRMPAPPSETTPVIVAIGLMERSAGNLSISGLAPVLGVTSRTLERSFLREVGLSPKSYARVLRFRAALSALELRRSASLASLAASLGYSDQAHFTREFTEFAGLSPAAYRRLSGAAVESGLSDSFKTDPDEELTMGARSVV